MQIQPVLTVLGVLFCLSACSVKTAQVQRVSAMPPVDGSGASASSDIARTQPSMPTVADFEPTDMSFRDIQLFLWKSDATPEDEAEALNRVKDYNDGRAELLKMKTRQSELKRIFSTIGVDVFNLPDLENQLPDRQTSLDKLQAKLDALLKQSSPNPEKVKTAQARRDKAKAAVDEVGIQLQAIHQNGLDDAYQVEWKNQGIRLDNAIKKATGLLAAVDEKVWVFNCSPMTFSFSFGADRLIHAKISNWDLSNINDPEVADEEKGSWKDFSTDSFTMGHATYAPHGGLFTFEVYSPRAVYWFKIARAEYDVNANNRSSDGRIHYKGDIVRCSVTGFGRPQIIHVRDTVQCGVDTSDLDVQASEVGQAVLRRGAANLVDQDAGHD
ncbi:hypothetical protein WDW37_13100 [Bdellovibrionota bacterium FG-1]